MAKKTLKKMAKKTRKPKHHVGKAIPVSSNLTELAETHTYVSNIATKANRRSK